MHDDNKLMELAVLGDKSAFETIVLRYRPAAVNFAYSFVRDSFTAEDIAQECFARLYVSRMSYKPCFSFKTYLYAIIRNCSIDYLRRNRAGRYVDLADISEPKCIETPESLLTHKENHDTIVKMLQSLKGDYRTALYLFAADGMSYAEIARVMRKTVPQIKILMYRARKKLKALCEGAELSEK